MHSLLPTSFFKTKATVVIAGVFSIAAALSFIIPSVSHFEAFCFPIIYDSTVFLFKPPYLYLVINCIILSIVATSKLTHKSCSSADDSDTVLLVPTYIDAGYLNVAHVVASDYTGENDATVKDVHEVIADDKLIAEDEVTKREKPRPSSDSPVPETEKPRPNYDSLEISVLKNTRKPPRFGRQKSLKASQEGKKSALGVSKPPRRQDTLETTWKKITEGPSTPLTKHFKKSDTWQERSKEKKKKMTKSESLKREPSPGQEELNRRVEAFIKKFNEEMRLQRLESLAKYNELMVNGGTHL